MCLHFEQEVYSECVPIDVVQAALDGDELNTCGACAPTPSPTFRYSCEGQRCAGNDYVYVCYNRETFCLDQEAAGLVLLSEQASCGKCENFICDVADFGCGNGEVEICHV
jgi:hypothetical protein